MLSFRYINALIWLLPLAQAIAPFVLTQADQKIPHGSLVKRDTQNRFPATRTQEIQATKSQFLESQISRLWKRSTTRNKSKSTGHTWEEKIWGYYCTCRRNHRFYGLTMIRRNNRMHYESKGKTCECSSTKPKPERQVNTKSEAQVSKSPQETGTKLGRGGWLTSAADHVIRRKAALARKLARATYCSLIARGTK